jgi:hypothetical protein
MSKIAQLEQEIESLTPEELLEFRGWFKEFEAKLWDEEFEQDVKAGRLDALAEQAIEDFQAGRFKKL